MQHRLQHIYPWLWLCVMMVEVMCKSTPQTRKEQIAHALEKGKAFLHHIQQQNGAIADTTNPLFNVWETVLAAKALQQINHGAADNAVQSAKVFLAENENAEGLICHNTKCKAGYCMETTAEYVTFLAHTEPPKILKQKLIPVIPLQKQAGYWEVGNPNVQEEKHFPSVTGFVLTMFQVADTVPSDLNTAYQWLIAQQTPEGHWGSAWEYYGCPAYALWVNMRALSTLHTPEAVIAMQKAQAYIESQQRKDGSWYWEGSIANRNASAELQTALMLSALWYAKNVDTAHVVVPAIDFLLAHQQNNGCWDGGFFPIDSPNYIKKEYVFATTQGLCVLDAYATTLP